MSQASSSTVINAINNTNNSNNSTWNRTPGKPGFGSGTGHSSTCGVSAIAVTTSTTAVSTSAAVTKTNNGPTADLPYSADAFISRDHRRTGAFSAVDGNSPSLAFPLVGSLDQPEFAGPPSSIPPFGPGQMWPPPFFETPDGIANDGNNNNGNNNKINSSINNDMNTSTSNFTPRPDIVASVAGAQWSIASRTAAAAMFTEQSQAIVPAAGVVWSLDASSNTAAASAANSSTGPSPVSGMPRAITGQLHQSSSAGGSGDSAGDVYPQPPHAKASASAPSTTAGAAPGTVWSTGGSLNEPSQLLTGGQSTLSSAFSKLHLTGATGQSDCFHDFSDGQLQIPHGISTISQPSGEPELHAAVDGSCSASKGCDKKSSVATSEVDVIYTPDPEEAIQAIVNSTEPWGTIPVDQSSPWDLTELSTAVASATGSGQDPVDCAPLLSSGDGRSLFDTSQQGPTGTCSGGQQRRLAASLSASRGDFESNIWPREPPNGTGIWEAHYESLGERTARWQQHPSVNPTQQQSSAAGPHQPSSSGQQFGQLPPPPPSSAITGNRSHFSGAAVASPAEATSSALFCSGVGGGGGYPIRPSAGLNHQGFSGLGGPLGSCNRSVGAGGGGPMSQLHLVDSLHPNGSSRNFPTAGSSTAWMHGGASGGLGAGPTGGGPTALDQKANRWPGNSNLGRIPSKHQHQQSFQSMLSAATGGGGAPSHANLQMPSGWPPTDPRRSASNPLSLRWSSATGGGGADSVPTAGGSGGYYGVPSPMHPLISPSMPPPPPGPRGFRPSLPAPQPQHQQQHGMFFQSPGQSSSSLSSSQRAGLLSTQQQLQQQSVLRANAMRQMIGMGFSEDEVHAVFSDTNANIPRALLELRERTCHSGLDDIIRMFTNSNNNNSGGGGTTNSGQFAMSTVDDLGVGELTGPIARIMARYGLSMSDQQQQQLACKVNSQMGGASSPENVDAALAIMRQKEAQILQTIVQLNNKRVELMTANIRQPNLQYPTGFMPMLNELRQQEILVGHQMNAQEAQLRHIRRQAEMLKQLTVASPSPSPLPPHQQPMGGSLGASGGQPWLGNVCLSGGGGTASPSLSSLSSGLVSGSAGVDMTAGGGPPGISDVHQLLLQQMSIEAGGYPEQCQPPAGLSGVGGNAGLKMGSGSFLWESGPWSGQSSSSGQAGSQDGYSTFNTVVGGGGQNAAAGGGGDNRRSSWSMNRQPQPGFPHSTSTGVNSLGADPRWIPGLESSVGADDEYFEGVGSSSTTAAGGGSRHWLLVHNIPPHMSVSVIKSAVASALTKSTAGGGGGGGGDQQQLLDFELHPNMSARWVLLGVNTAASANLVLDYLDGGGGSGNAGGGHYGCVKMIGAVEAFQRLQDIQSLACRLKGLAADSYTAPSGASGHGFIRSFSAYQHHQPNSQLPFSVGNDLGMHDGTAAAALFATSSTCEGAALGGI